MAGLGQRTNLAIIGTIQGLSALGWTDNARVYPLSLLATVALETASYRWLESPFLRLKGRFAKVPSGEQARQDARAIGSARR